MEDVTQLEAIDADETTNAADDSETIAGKKKGDDDGDGIIAVLIG